MVCLAVRDSGHRHRLSHCCWKYLPAQGRGSVLVHADLPHPGQQHCTSPQGAPQSLPPRGWRCVEVSKKISSKSIKNISSRRELGLPIRALRTKEGQ